MDLGNFLPGGPEPVVRRRQSLDFCSPHDRSPVVSPWGRANSRSNSKSSIIQVGTDNVVLVEVGSSEDGPGPYITRVHGGEGRNSIGPVSLPHTSRPREPFSGILATAGNNITQAESILSSLGHERLRANLSDSEEEDPTSLGNSKKNHGGYEYITLPLFQDLTLKQTFGGWSELRQKSMLLLKPSEMFKI